MLVGQRLQAFVQVFSLRVDGLGRARPASGGELAVVDVDRDHARARRGCARDGAKADHAAAEDDHRLAGGCPPARGRVPAHRQRLDQDHVPQRQSPRRKQLGCRNDDLLGQGAVALNPEGLIVATSVGAALATRGTRAAIGVRHDQHMRSRRDLGADVGTDGVDDARDLVARHARVADQGIEAAEGVEVRAAEPEVAHAHADLAAPGYRPRDLANLGATGRRDEKRSHACLSPNRYTRRALPPRMAARSAADKAATISCTVASQRA